LSGRGSGRYSSGKKKTSDLWKDLLILNTIGNSFTNAGEKVKRQVLGEEKKKSSLYHAPWKGEQHFGYQGGHIFLHGQRGMTRGRQEKGKGKSGNGWQEKNPLLTRTPRILRILRRGKKECRAARRKKKSICHRRKERIHALTTPKTIQGQFGAIYIKKEEGGICGGREMLRTWCNRGEQENALLHRRFALALAIGQKKAEEGARRWGVKGK